MQAADGRKADAVDDHRLAAMHDGEVVPRLHLRRDELIRRRVVGAQELERLVGEHDAEAKCRVRRILLDHPDLPMRMRTLGEIGEVQAGRAGADDEDVHLLEKRPQILELVEEMPDVIGAPVHPMRM